MARTSVAYSDLAANSDTDDPAGTALNAGADAGHTIADAEPEQTILRIDASAGGDITIVAGDSPPAIAAGQGDLTVTVGIETRWIGPLESGRFLQNDGSLLIDVESGAAGTITAFRVPRYT
ncbi:hypothetical protein [Streptomyces sp. CNQ085]|uniref:hypothetical protein n=1 Tax=Streptomyces sp. CNQ085 TaxID=2886944 RepID=UPI001F508B8B|nr:hypothetical protein [Streptomyces sp. CNQ085]MCI0386662.1 hypothetical protein [Streptomyces sp. CNQ085]